MRRQRVQRVRTVSAVHASPGLRRAPFARALILAAASMALAAGPAGAAPAPEYQVFEVRSPEPQAQAFFGERVRGLADVDGDGVRDVLMTASQYDGDDGMGGVLANSGRVYVFSGQTQAAPARDRAPVPAGQRAASASGPRASATSTPTAPATS